MPIPERVSKKTWELKRIRRHVERIHHKRERYLQSHRRQGHIESVWKTVIGRVMDLIRVDEMKKQFDFVAFETMKLDYVMFEVMRKNFDVIVMIDGQLSCH